MKGDPIPDDHNVLRYVRPGLVDHDVVGGGAFVLRDADLQEAEPSLSINWLDYFENLFKDEQVSHVRRLFRLTVRPNGRFAELNVGYTKNQLAKETNDLRFVEHPLPAVPEEGHEEDPSHASIQGLPNPNDLPEHAELVGDMIAECVVNPLYPAVEEES